MNGRMYDAQLGRFLSPDNYVQDPYNTQNFNRYGYVLNNPLVFSDPSGEFFFAALIGAAIGVITNGINNTINGQGFFEGAGKAALIGGFQGTFSFGIGSLTSSIAQTSALAAGIFQVTSHAVLGGVSSALQGGDFGTGALSGAIGSIIGSSGSKYLANASGFVKAVGTTLIGGLSGGVGSRLAGGKFWDGFRNGAISAGLNHAAHSLQQVNPARLKRKILADGRLTLREANKWYRHGRGEALTVDASKIDLDFINPNDYIEGGKFKPVQTLYKSKDGLVYGNVKIKRIQGAEFKIDTDNYGFEMHKGSSFGTFARNMFTKIGGFIAGQGINYDIHFRGSNFVNPKRYPIYNR